MQHSRRHPGALHLHVLDAGTYTESTCEREAHERMA